VEVLEALSLVFEVLLLADFALVAVLPDDFLPAGGCFIMLAAPGVG